LRWWSQARRDVSTVYRFFEIATLRSSIFFSVRILAPDSQPVALCMVQRYPTPLDVLAAFAIPGSLNEFGVASDCHPPWFGEIAKGTG